MTNYLNEYIEQLLHIDDVNKNKLINLNATNANYKTLVLNSTTGNNHLDFVEVIRKKYGKLGNTILRESALQKDLEQRIGNDLNVFDWSFIDGSKDTTQLHKFISDMYKELNLKGNNPFFLSLGSLKFKCRVDKDSFDDVICPILLFPVRLLRSSQTNPITIEFLKEDIYYNPCLFAKLKETFSEDLSSSIPLLDGVSTIDDVIDISLIDNIDAYFTKLSEFVSKIKEKDPNSSFDFNPDMIAISSYNHNEICMYHDIRKNREKILNSELVRKTFTDEKIPEQITPIAPEFVLDYDDAQNQIIFSANSSESLVIKGPPGTGKTLTITNILASLLSQGKKVIISTEKLGALSEIVAKLPAELRKFVLLLDSETEAEASHLNTNAIKKDLNSLLQEKSKFTFDNNLITDKNYLQNDINNISKEIVDYRNFLFDENCVSDSLYGALNSYYSYDVPTLDFIENKEHFDITRGELNAYLSTLHVLNDSYVLLTGNKTYSLLKNPFVGILNEDYYEPVYNRYYSLLENSEENYLKLFDIFNNENIDLDNVSLLSVLNLGNYQLTLEEITKLITDPNFKDNSLLLSRSLDNFIINYKDENNSLLTKYESVKDNIVNDSLALGQLKYTEHLTYKEFRSLEKIESSFDVLKSLSVEQEKLFKSEITLYNSLKDDEDVQLKEFRKIFKKDLNDDQYKEISTSIKTFERYFDTESEKPSALDFSAKGKIKKLAEFSYLSDPTFKEIVSSLAHYNQYLKDVEEEKQIVPTLSRILEKQISLDDLVIYSIIYSKSEDVTDFVNEYLNNKEKVIELYDKLIPASDEEILTLIKALNILYYYHILITNLNLFNLNYELQDCVSLARTIVTISILNKDLISEDNAKVIYSLHQNIISSNVDLKVIKKTFETFSSLKKDDYIDNYYSMHLEDLTLNDMKIFFTAVKDKSLMSEANNFNKKIRLDENALLREFFKLYDSRSNYYQYDTLSVFSKTIYGIVINNKLAQLKGDRYNFGEHQFNKLQSLALKRNKLKDINVKIIEKHLMDHINVNDPDFAFLNKENDSSMNLRLFFKKFGSSIFKLKSCLLLSPSTASLLLGNECFENFDFAIFDEASQLLPVKSLPILFRSKHALIVGDEWQMPPISHFKKTKENSDFLEDDLKAEPSLLSLALNHTNYRTLCLKAHFRSETESLIKFSKEHFYDEMKTFPAILPQSENLGFEDIYVENATSDAGVNPKEAEKILELIKLHFDKYYQEVDGKFVLTKSLGIITFGEKQHNYILNKVAKDTELSKKIATARANKKPNQTDDKVIFFKPIEQAQGQESAVVILSLTYGVDKNGNKVNRFGELNRGELGKCIFNVAVSRAKEKMIVIHSILPIDMQADSSSTVGFIRDYLYTANKYSKLTDFEFSSDNSKVNDFYQEIGKYIISQGIDKERIVYNYGVTKGSIRIPLVILSKDKQRASYGFYLERPLNPSENYFDIYMNYYNILINVFKWKLKYVSIIEWLENSKNIKEEINTIVNKIKED